MREDRAAERQRQTQLPNSWRRVHDQLREKNQQPHERVQEAKSQPARGQHESLHILMQALIHGPMHGVLQQRHLVKRSVAQPRRTPEKPQKIPGRGGNKLDVVSQQTFLLNYMSVLAMKVGGGPLGVGLGMTGRGDFYD